MRKLELDAHRFEYEQDVREDNRGVNAETFSRGNSDFGGE